MLVSVTAAGNYQCADIQDFDLTRSVTFHDTLVSQVGKLTADGLMRQAQEIGQLELTQWQPDQVGSKVL